MQKVPSRTAKAEVSMGHCGPWALFTEGVLAGELKIKWVYTSIPDSLQRLLGIATVVDTGCGQEHPGELCARDTLTGQL